MEATAPARAALPVRSSPSASDFTGASNSPSFRPSPLSSAGIPARYSASVRGEAMKSGIPSITGYSLPVAGSFNPSPP